MKKYFIIFVLIIISVLLFSCEKKQRGHFTVSGYYYSLDDSMPIRDKYLYVYYQYSTYPLNINNMSKTVGEGYTDSSGYFEFVCEYYTGGRYNVNRRYPISSPRSSKVVVNVDTIYSW